MRERIHTAAQILPIHMRPTRIRLVNDIPRLPSFKPDIKKLESLEASVLAKEPRPCQPQYSPTTEREAKFAICRQLLKTDNLELTDNFFEAGGNSLLAMSLMLEIETQLGLEIGLDTIFDCPSIAKLCTALDESAELTPAVVLPLKFRLGEKTLYFTHSSSAFSTLSDALTSDLSTAFVTMNGTRRLRQLIAGGDVLAAVDQISEAYTKAILARHKTEFCCLAGHSFGGIIALETACKLQERGATPDIVFLFDTYLHGAIHRILYDIRYNGWLARKVKEVVRGN